MIQETSYKVDKKIIDEIAKIDVVEKYSFNQPTGDFFYDPWVIKPEYKGTAVEELLSTLPTSIGEARLITLKSGNCYYSHSDIDDRYHLNINGDCAALINLETKHLWFLTNDGVWYDMDAGPLHSATNFGQYDRKQIVVRKLLNKNVLENPLKIIISPGGDNPRFVFDNTISPWLNRANKNRIISNFKTDGVTVSFNIEESYLSEFKKILPKKFICNEQ
jgi:hypothetical protein